MRNGTGLGVEERITSLFQPDILLSAQYFATSRSRLQLQPEKKLILAILEDAVACFQNYLLAHHKKGKEILLEAEDWIREQNRDWPFSFDNICETLGFDHEYIRQGLLRWKENKLAESPKAKIYHFPSRRKREMRGTAHMVFRTQAFRRRPGYGRRTET